MTKMFIFQNVMFKNNVVFFVTVTIQIGRDTHTKVICSPPHFHSSEIANV